VILQWINRQSYLDDLASLDPELYRGLLKLKNYPGNVEEDLSLNFTVTEEGAPFLFRPSFSSFTAD
jgi:ubiquitin-protein ligase E3 C